MLWSCAYLLQSSGWPDQPLVVETVWKARHHTQHVVDVWFLRVNAYDRSSLGFLTVAGSELLLFCSDKEKFETSYNQVEGFPCEVSAPCHFRNNNNNGGPLKWPSLSSLFSLRMCWFCGFLSHGSYGKPDQLCSCTLKWKVVTNSTHETSRSFAQVLQHDSSTIRDTE